MGVSMTQFIKRTIIAFLLALPVIAQGQDLTTPEKFDIKIDMSAVKHVRDANHYTVKGYAYKTLHLYSAKGSVLVSHNDGSESYTRPIWVSFSSTSEQNEIMLNCKDKGLIALKDQNYSPVVSIYELPYAAVLKDPEDLRNAKDFEYKARLNDKNSKAKYNNAVVDYKALQAQIANLNVLASKAPANKKAAYAQQVAALKLRADQRIAQAELVYKKEQEQSANWREKAKISRERIEKRSAELQSILNEINNDISDITAKIEKMIAKGDAFQAEKAKVQLQFKIDRKEKIEAELEDTKPGLRSHISVNVDKFKSVCE